MTLKHFKKTNPKLNTSINFLTLNFFFESRFSTLKEIATAAVRDMDCVSYALLSDNTQGYHLMKLIDTSELP